MRTISVILAAVMLACTLVVGALAIASAEKTAADLLGGREVIETIQKADQVEVFRMTDQYQQRQLSDYKLAGGPAKITPELAKELARIVSAHDSYDRTLAKGCVPIYGVQATFTRGKSQVDVLFCFGCQVLEVFHNGKTVGGGNFDPAMKSLTKLAQAAFPDDKAIQGIGKE